jgi:hypothetical protein
LTESASYGHYDPMDRNALRRERIANGLCRDCGNVPPRTGRKICLNCHVARTERQSRRAAKLKASGQCVQCRALAVEGKTLCQQCSDFAIESARHRRRENKLAVIERFGGKCSECGESDIRTLTIDHVNNDGNIECAGKSKRITSVEFYARLVKDARARIDLKLLCFNCHAKKDLAPWWLKED